MLRKLRLKEVGPSTESSFTFAPRLNILTGDNGVGKTFILDIASWAVTGFWSRRPAVPKHTHQVAAEIYCELGTAAERNFSATARYDPQEYLWSVGEFGDSFPVDDGIVVYAKTNGSYVVWDSSRNSYQVEELFHDLGEITGPRYVSNKYLKHSSWIAVQSASGVPFYYQFKVDEVFDGLVSNGKTLCRGLYQDWNHWQRNGAPEYHRLSDMLKALSHPREPISIGQPSKVFPDDLNESPTLQLPYGTVPIKISSSAMRRVAALAYLLVWSWSEHVTASKELDLQPTKNITVLIDEPECHLHPKWQRTILPSLMRALQAFAASNVGNIEPQIFCATHSPLVMASLEPHFDESRDKLFVLELTDDDQVVVQQPDWYKRGDVVGWLTSGVFDLGQARSLEAEQVIKEAEDFMRGKGSRPKADIESDLTRLLPSIDPFWPRWDLSRFDGEP